MTTEEREAQQRLRAMKMAMDAVNKQFGAGTLRRMGDAPLEGIKSISTRCIGIDNLTGVGGIPQSRITEIFGPESAGKTTLALHIIAEAQSRGMLTAIVDAEHALSESWATTLGVNVSDLFISQPSCGEEALEVTEALVRSGSAGLVVVDSVAALVPRAELEGEMGDQLPGLQARLMGQAMRKLTGVTAKSHTALVFINQVRTTIPMGGQMYGSKETTTGGRALKFYASLRLETRRIASIKHGDEVIGNLTRVKAVKNKMARPFLECEVDLIYGEGFSGVNSIIDTAVEWGILSEERKSYSYEGEKLAQGRDAVAGKLKEDKKLQFEIRDKILSAVEMEQKEKSAQKSAAVS